MQSNTQTEFLTNRDSQVLHINETDLFSSEYVNQPNISRNSAQRIYRVTFQNESIELQPLNRHINNTLAIYDNWQTQGLSIVSETPFDSIAYQHCFLNFASNLISTFGVNQILRLIIVISFSFAIFFLLKLFTLGSLSSSRTFLGFNTAFFILSIFNIYVLAASLSVNRSTELSRLYSENRTIVTLLLILNVLIFSYLVSEFSMDYQQLDIFDGYIVVITTLLLILIQYLLSNSHSCLYSILFGFFWLSFLILIDINPFRIFDINY